MTTSEQFTNALQERRAIGTCPICGTNDWTCLGKPGDVDSVAVIKIVGDLLVSDQFHAFFGLACNNCGFLRLHMPEVLGL